MEVASVALQQAGAQTKTAVSMLKQAARSEQALVDIIEQAAKSGSRGQNLDVTV